MVFSPYEKKSKEYLVRKVDEGKEYFDFAQYDYMWGGRIGYNGGAWTSKNGFAQINITHYLEIPFSNDDRWINSLDRKPEPTIIHESNIRSELMLVLVMDNTKGNHFIDVAQYCKEDTEGCCWFRWISHTNEMAYPTFREEEQRFVVTRYMPIPKLKNK